MDWTEQNACQSHSHLDNHIHGHGHSHGGPGGHGPGGHGHARGGMMHGYRAGIPGPFGPRNDIVMDPTQQPKKRSHMDDSSSWDIVKATQFGILDRCKELIEAGYDVRVPDKENVSLLHWAAINNRTEVVEYYISKGAIVDQLGGDLNSTPLHWAIRQGLLSMVILLLRHGADPSLADGEGFCALHLAVLFQHMPIAAYLMAKGQDVDCQDRNGQTSLMLAAQKIIGPEPTNFLLKCNASVSAVDNVNRNSPLHCAVLAGNVDAAHILLEAGASVELENAKGQTPIALANQVQSPLLLHMLNCVKKERIKLNSPFFRKLKTYKFQLELLFSVFSLWAVGAIVDMSSESWLLKGVLLACLLAAVNLFTRQLVGLGTPGPQMAPVLIGSIIWMLVTWFLWFLPEVPDTTVQVLFAFSTWGLVYCYYKTWRTDPGHVKATEEERKKNVVMLAEAGCLDPRTFCTSCMTRKPMRANHCHTCNSCIAKQDHHSVWINGCIGARNHRFFVMFLVFLTLIGAWMFYGSIIYWLNHCQFNLQEQGRWGVFTELVGCSPWLIYIFAITFFHTSWSSVFLLLQLYQIAVYGLTSSERVNLLQRRKTFPQSFSLRQNPYNLGLVRNVVNFFQLRCCGLCKPTVVDWTQQYSMGPDHHMACARHSV